jgi:hypothetical protein
MRNIRINKKAMKKVSKASDDNLLKIHLVKRTKNEEGLDVYKDAGELEIKIFGIPKPGFTFTKGSTKLQ